MSASDQDSNVAAAAASVAPPASAAAATPPPSSTASKVELYIYDLSGGLARQLSMAFLGKQFDGVWHTSIVVHWALSNSDETISQEYFFGGAAGISITGPGESHHGQPVEVLSLGETEMDLETWSEILDDLRDRYPAHAYNLMTYNCNTFSNDVAEILVGEGIPAHITSLPADFQTALGAMQGRAGGAMPPATAPQR